MPCHAPPCAAMRRPARLRPVMRGTRDTPDLLGKATDAGVIHLAGILLRCPLADGVGERESAGLVGQHAATVRCRPASMRARMPPAAWRRRLLACGGCWHSKLCSSSYGGAGLARRRAWVMLKTTGSTSRGRMRIMVSVVTSRLTRVLGSSLSLSTLLRQPTT